MGLKCELKIPTKAYDSKTRASSTVLNLVSHRPHLAGSLNMFYCLLAVGFFFFF